MSDSVFAQVNEEIVYFNAEEIDIAKKEKVFLQIINEIFVPHKVKQFEKEIKDIISPCENIQNLKEKILNDCKKWDLEVKKWYFNVDMDRSQPKGIIFTGNLGRVLCKYYTAVCKKYKTSLHGSLPESSMADLKVNYPFFYVTDESRYQRKEDFKGKFVHEIAHWYIYKFYEPNNIIEKKNCREGFAMLIQKEIVGYLSYENGEGVPDELKPALELAKTKTKEWFIECLKK
ncbi:MAG: hypothetical protein ABIJ15_00325 [bacterium]